MLLVALLKVRAKVRAAGFFKLGGILLFGMVFFSVGS
jgi:hypothetical protein